MQKSSIQVHEKISLRPYSTLRVGGEARFFSEAYSIEQMQELFCFAKKCSVPVLIIGKGSNTLFDDRGYSGLVILNKMKKIIFNSSSIYVESGYSFSRLGKELTRLGFSGFEFANGIPGSVGGAVYMNAGAYGSSTGDFLDFVEFLDAEGKFHRWSQKTIQFGYRYSSLQSIVGSIVAASFTLTKQNINSKDLEKRNIQNRILSQPYKELSCGCIFRNPEETTAGKIIDLCGLKGLAIGDAEVSSIHANFIINRGEATSKDVLRLIELVQSRVFARFGCMLQPEIRYIPYV